MTNFNKVMENNQTKWEFSKNRTGKFTIDYSKTIAKEKNRKLIQKTKKILTAT